jgi:regulatory protein
LGCTGTPAFFVLEMVKVTGVKDIGRQRRQLYVDGRYAITVDATVLAERGLNVGDEVNGDALGELATAAEVQRCRESAFRLLEYRARSRAELVGRLLRRGFQADTVESVATRLVEQGLLNDAEFAQSWQENRGSFSPRSRAMLRRELRAKGVAAELIDEAVTQVDDTAAAYRAVAGRAARLKTEDYFEFKNRLGGFLRRRGFDYAVIKVTLERLWRERAD